MLHEPADAWEQYVKDHLLRLYGDYLGKFISSQQTRSGRGRVEHLIPLAEQDFYSLTSMMDTVFSAMGGKAS